KPDEYPNLSLFVPANRMAYAELPVDKEDRKYVGSQCLIVDMQLNSGIIRVKQQKNALFFQNSKQVVEIRQGEAVRFTNIGSVLNADNYGEWIYEYLMSAPVTRD